MLFKEDRSRIVSYRARVWAFKVITDLLLNMGVCVLAHRRYF